jgi:hypothetical protein
VINTAADRWQDEKFVRCLRNDVITEIIDPRLNFEYLRYTGTKDFWTQNYDFGPEFNGTIPIKLKKNSAFLDPNT